MAGRIAVDYLYDRVCNDYKYYLAEQCVCGEAQNTSCAEDQESVVDSKKNTTGIGVLLLIVGIVIFPMIVWGIGKPFGEYSVCEYNNYICRKYHRWRYHIGRSVCYDCGQ